MRVCSLLAAAVLLAAAPAAAQPSITVAEAECLPTGANGLLRATAASEPAGGSARLYFRWKEHASFYWLALEPEAPGRYWAVPPKPERRNDEVEYYGVLVDAGGREVARSETRIVRVEDDCRVRLTPREAGVAENLTIGETVAGQKGKEVMGFLCDGIVTRVDDQGVRRADEVCRACVVAWWKKAAVLVPLAGVTGIIITDDDPPEVSPSRP